MTFFCYNKFNWEWYFIQFNGFYFCFEAFQTFKLLFNGEQLHLQFFLKNLNCLGLGHNENKNVIREVKGKKFDLFSELVIIAENWLYF